RDADERAGEGNADDHDAGTDQPLHPPRDRASRRRARGLAPGGPLQLGGRTRYDLLIGHALQIPVARADRDGRSASAAPGFRRASPPESPLAPLSSQAPPARPRPGLLPVPPPRRIRALAKVVGLITLTAIGLTLVTAVAAGSALFAILNIG